MSLPFDTEQRFCVQATLGTGDSSKVLKAAAANEQIVVTDVWLTSLTSAAQVQYVGDESATVKALSLAASITAGVQAHLRLKQGLALTIGEDLIVKPAAAGPSVHVVAEGYILRS